jgi:hypothetical protein
MGTSVTKGASTHLTNTSPVHFLSLVELSPRDLMPILNDAQKKTFRLSPNQEFSFLPHWEMRQFCGNYFPCALSLFKKLSKRRFFEDNAHLVLIVCWVCCWVIHVLLLIQHFMSLYLCFSINIITSLWKKMSFGGNASFSH